MFRNFRRLGQEAIGIVDRPKMLRFLLSLKRSDGSFSLHDRGETDTRGSTAFVFNHHHEKQLILFRQAIALLQSLACAD
jgi:prenyltransferase beta subunit